METGIVLIKTAPSRAAEIGEDLVRVPGVNQVLVVEGTYQLAAMVAAGTASDLSALIDRQIAARDGVESTELMKTKQQFTRREVRDELTGFGP